MDEPRGDDRQGGPREPGDPRRRRRRGRARAGLPLARRRGDLIEGERRLLPREEEFASEQVTEALEDMGVDVRTGRKATRSPRGRRRSRSTLGRRLDADGERAARRGRPRPRTEELGLDELGLEAAARRGRRALQVPGHDWLYAIGDVNGRVLLTHMGKYQARIAADAHPRPPTAAEHGADGRQPARDLHRPPGRRRRAHRAERARGRRRGRHRRRRRPRPTPAAPSTGATRPARRAS